MRLSDYLRLTGESQTEFARRIGVTDGTVTKYLHRGHIPRPEIMTAIREATNDAVTPNDFYPSPEPTQKTA